LDYVMTGEITSCWVVKHYRADLMWGGIWVTEARFALSLEIYKPPFHVAFWRREETVRYSDPPDGGVDSVGMFGSPAEVLSVALTRAVARIVGSQDLDQLINEDPGTRSNFSLPPWGSGGIPLRPSEQAMRDQRKNHPPRKWTGGRFTFGFDKVAGCELSSGRREGSARRKRLSASQQPRNEVTWRVA
jgi:hypothetical protein